ncbi:MAG: guanylate kinase [Chlorobi bacterium]|nr:guanylate kinase [Chlorobiota bacterium]
MILRERQTGKVIIISAPSGAGKTTIVKHLLMKIPALEFSVSACSRPPRPHEQEGKDYYFLSVDDFKKKIKEDAFLEWEEVYENQYYGTLKSEIERIWSKGHHVLFDVDVKGGMNLKNKLGDRALAVFVMPPSVQALENRLRKRSTESEESLRKRIEKAKEELGYAPSFDRILVNDVLADALDAAEKTVLEFLTV